MEETNPNETSDEKPQIDEAKNSDIEKEPSAIENSRENNPINNGIEKTDTTLQIEEFPALDTDTLNKETEFPHQLS
jgi:hypothetical protein